MLIITLCHPKGLSTRNHGHTVDLHTDGDCRVWGCGGKIKVNVTVSTPLETFPWLSEGKAHYSFGLLSNVAVVASIWHPLLLL